MIKAIPPFRNLVLLFSGMLVCTCQQGQVPYAANPPDLSDPAADVTYGVEEVPYQEYPGCGPLYNGFTLRPSSNSSLYFVRDEMVDDHQLTDYVVEYVLNRDVLPHYAESPQRAYIRLVDWHEGESTWRACAIEVIRTAYYRIWNKAAWDCYGIDYARLPRSHKACILEDFPLMVVAAGPWIIPPPPPPADWEG